MRSEVWSAGRVKGGVAVDYEQLKRSAKGHNNRDTWKLSLKQRSRFIWRYPGDVGHVLGHDLRKSELAADDERRRCSANVVILDVDGTDGRGASDRHKPVPVGS
jgi:hypothetical protein